MEQKITIRIADRDYDLKSNSQEQEERIRKAALMLNRLIDSYQKKFSKRDIIDILSLVALNQGISLISLMQKTEDYERRCNDLSKDIEDYLANI